MGNGLDGNRSSEMLMLPSMVDFLPNGYDDYMGTLPST